MESYIGYILALIFAGAGGYLFYLLNEERKKLEDTVEGKVRAETILSERIRLLDQALSEKKEAENRRDQALQQMNEADTQAKLARQSTSDMQKRMDDWEKTKEEIVKANKASVGEIFRKEAEELNKRTLEGFQNVNSAMATIKEQTNKIDANQSILWRSLSTSSAIGQFSENALFNTLKQYGLIEGKDFFYQPTFQNQDDSKRPDFVIRMPGNNLIVIDSKASQFFLELAKQQGTDKEAETTERLRKSMNDHVNSLASKEYRETVRKFYEKSGWKDQVNTIYMVMFLHSEAAVDKICEIDAGIQQKCISNGIMLLGPRSLAGPLYAATMAIEREQQGKNYELILAEVQNLLGNLAVTLSHVGKTGKALKSAYDSFRNFAGSINRNILPKGRKIQSLGISLPKGKELPESINTYEGDNTIELQAEEITETKKLENAE